MTEGARSLRAWWRRPSNRAFREQIAGVELGKGDDDANARTKLPDDEEVHLAGILLAEAFTPSSVGRLRDAVERLPGMEREKKVELLRQLDKYRRSSTWGGSTPIGYAGARAWVHAPAFYDEELPTDVETVRLHLHAVTPSLTVVVATFSYPEQDGDLSPLLGASYETRLHDRITVPGRLGALRAWNPLGRPQLRGTRGTITTADEAKRLACEAFIGTRQDACRRWFAARFPGCFSEVEPGRRPAVRILLTKIAAPFDDDPSWRKAVGLWPAYDRWDSGAEGWAFRVGEMRSENLDQIIAAAPQTSTDGGAAPKPDVLERFHALHGGLFARWAAHRLLALRLDQLAALRDEAAARGRNRAVRDAEAIDAYLRTNGLDARTVVAEIERVTANSPGFLLGLPVYSRTPPAPGGTAGATEDFRQVLCDSMNATAERLATDTEAATPSIVASAGLRQSILNTKLQRRALVASIVAAAIAAVSLAIATVR